MGAALLRLSRGPAAGTALAVAALLPTTASARVVRVEIVQRTPLLGGRDFGGVGAYEKLVGRVHFAVAPDDPANARVTDLRLAPRNARGEVEFWADLYVLRPVRGGNGAALVEIANRGNKQLLTFFDRARGTHDPTAEAETGDGFLLRQGFTLVWVGWQFDVPPDSLAVGGRAPRRLRLAAPVASRDGRPVSGLVRADWVVNDTVFDRPLADGGHVPYAAVRPTSAEHALTVRDAVAGPRRVVPRGEWRFARVVDGRVVPDSTWIWLRGGFRPGRIYELVYRSEGPPLAGLGLAAVRDLVSHLKHDTAAVAPARTAYGFGISQSGRYLRTFLYEGFNADEAGRRVFDGVLAHIAGAGRGGYDVRFAQPSRASAPLSALHFPNDLFPFTDLPQTDPATGAAGGLLDRARAAGVVPKLFLTNSTSEYWSRAGALVHTSADGTRDVPLGDSTRLYVFTGTQHVPAGFPPPPNGRYAMNPNDFTWSLRALLVAMHRWVVEGTAPPASVHPRLADSTLVPRERLAFPAVPGVVVPRAPYEPHRVDYGPEQERGVLHEPPRVGAPFPALVPQVDRDGNERAGIRMPEVAVPLATYTGWNVRRPEHGFPLDVVGLTGAWLPFPATRAARERAGDPRASIEERYASRDAYLGASAEAALRLVRAGFLLPEDVPALLDAASVRWAHATR